MENNLSESEKSWKETIEFIKSVQCTREELMPDCDGIELPAINFPFELGKIGDDLYDRVFRIISPKQIDITAQEKHINSIIDKDYEFVNEYCKKHNININELALQKNNRAITSNTHGNLFSVMVGLNLSGVNFFKNCFFYFDLGNNRFLDSREECIQLINEIINDCLNNDLKFINAFTKHYKQIFNIFSQQTGYDKSVKELQQLINQENPNDNFEITKQTIRIKENIDNTIHIRDKNIFKFTYNNENEIIITNVLNDIKCEIQLNIKDKNFSKSISASSLATSNLKQKLNEWIEEFIPIKCNSNPIYVIPIPYINPNFNGKFIDLGDSIGRGPEFITCLIIYALLAQAMPNSIICLLGNHETKVQNESLQNLIEFCIEKKALRTGYIEKAIKDGQEIYHSYSHAMLQKEDLTSLFVLLYIIFNIDTEKKFLREEDIEIFAKHIKEKWPKRFSELPEKLQTKVINFFDKNNLKQLDIKFDDPNDSNYIAEFHKFDDFFAFIDFFLGKPYLFHQILKNAGFNDIDFVELRNAVGDIIYNKYHLHIRESKFKRYIKNTNGSFMHTQEYILETYFYKIYQHICLTSNNFTLIPKALNGRLINHNVSKNVGYNGETASRTNLFILNIHTNNYFIIDGFVSRNGYEISKESEIIIDDSISQIILHESDDEKLYKTYGELKEYVRDIKNFTNKAIDENLIKKSLTENNEPEETKIILAKSKESWQTAANFINQKHNPETVKSDLLEIIMNTRKNDLNSLIDKIYAYANTYTESNDLKENSYFSLITKLIKQNIINFNKSLPSLHFDLKNNEFINKEKYKLLIYNKVNKSQNAILLIRMFINYLPSFLSIYPIVDPNILFKNPDEMKTYIENQISQLQNLISSYLNFQSSISKQQAKKYAIKEEYNEIKFSDENQNYITISKPSENHQYIKIESKLKKYVNENFEEEKEIELNYLAETPISINYFVKNYNQKVYNTAINWQLNLIDNEFKTMNFYFEIPIPIAQSKEKFICFLKEPTNVIQQIEHEEESVEEESVEEESVEEESVEEESVEEESVEKFIKKLIETYDQKNKETITCFLTLALTALSNPNIKFILSNYETTFCGNEYFAKLIDYCIEEKIFINGYIEEVIENGKQIWHSYSHTIFTKKHLQKLFAILFVLIYIDKEIQRLNDCGKDLSFYLENYLKTKWPIKLKELPKESQEKLLSFFDENNLQKLNLNTWEDFLKIDWQNFYEILITTKFTDIEFFSLKIIICDIFHNEYYSEANYIWKPLFSAITGKMNWLFHEEYIPQNPNETFSVIQHLELNYENIKKKLILETLNKPIKSWDETVDLIKKSQDLNERKILIECFNEISSSIQSPSPSNFKFDKFQRTRQALKIVQIDIPEQEAYFNILISKVSEFKNMYFEDFKKRYKEKHSNDKTEFNIDIAALQEDTRAVMSDIHGDFFSLMAALATIGVADLLQNYFLYFDLNNCQFVNRDKALKLTNIFVIPFPFINNIKGKVINCGDIIDRGPESIACLVINTLLAQAMPDSIICLLGNHEAMRYTLLNYDWDNFLSCGDLIINFIDFCVQKNILRTGYIEKGIKDGKEIHHVYSHAILLKEHLPKLFNMLYNLNLKTESRNKETTFIKKLLERWKDRFEKLNKDLKLKVNTFKSSSQFTEFLKTHKLRRPYSAIEDEDFKDFYNTLINFGFKDVEFFELKFAIGDVFHNNYYHFLASKIGYSYGLDYSIYGWLFAERHEPKLSASEQIIPNIIQYLGHNFRNYLNIFATFIYLDLRRSCAYRNGESRVALLVFNIIVVNKMITIDGFLKREVIDDTIYKISNKSKVILNEEHKLILPFLEYFRKIQDTFNGLINFFNESKEDAIKNKKGEPKKFSSTKSIKSMLFPNDSQAIPPLASDYQVQQIE